MKTFLEWIGESVATGIDLSSFQSVKPHLMKWLKEYLRDDELWFMLKAKSNQEVLSYVNDLDARTGGDVSKAVEAMKTKVARAVSDGREMQARMENPGFMAPEETRKWRAIRDANQGAGGSRATGRYTKSLFVSKADQSNLSKFTYVHWCGSRSAEDFIEGRVSNRAEISARIYSDISKVGDRSMMWNPSAETYGVVLKGFVTAFGSDDLSSDNRQHAQGDGKPLQKYVGKPHFLDPAGAFNPEDKTGNEALIDNWRVVGLVAQKQSSGPVVAKAKSKGIPIHFV